MCRWQVGCPRGNKTLLCFLSTAYYDYIPECKEKVTQGSVATNTVHLFLLLPPALEDPYSVIVKSLDCKVEEP